MNAVKPVIPIAPKKWDRCPSAKAGSTCKHVKTTVFFFIFVVFLRRHCLHADPLKYCRTLSKTLAFIIVCVCQGQLKEVTTSPTERVMQRLVSTTPKPPPSMHFDSSHGLRYSAPVSSFILHRCKDNIEAHSQLWCWKLTNAWLPFVMSQIVGLQNHVLQHALCEKKMQAFFGWEFSFYFPEKLTVKLNSPS